MATSGDQNQEENERSFNLDEALRSFKESGDGSESESDEKPEDLTMFCKTCLNPYCGEQKAGTIVLRCEKCGQTDTVLEEKAVDLDHDQWIGNLMMNRFMQVLKEQEDLGLNIADPHFAEDDFKKYALATSEYTFNMKALSDHLHRIVSQAKILREAMNNVTDEEVEAVERERLKNPEEFERRFEAQKREFLSSVEQGQSIKPKGTDSDKNMSGDPGDSVDEAVETGSSEASVIGKVTGEPTVELASDLNEMKSNEEVDTYKPEQTDTDTGRDTNSKIESSGREGAIEPCGNDTVQDNLDSSDMNRELQSEIGGSEPDTTGTEENDGELSDKDDMVMMDYLPASFREQLKELPSVVIGLIQTLITKYELPQELYDDFMDRLWNPASEAPKEAPKKDDNAVEDRTNAAVSKDAASEPTASESTKATSEPKASESTKADACDESEANDGSAEKTLSDSEDTTSEDEEYFFNITKKKLKSEVFDTLYPKFSVNFQSKTEAHAKDTDKKKTCDNQKENKHDGENLVKEGAANDTSTIVTALKNSSEAKGNETNDGSTASGISKDKLNNEEVDSESSNPPVKYRSAPEGVSFHAISTAFISELQKRKHKALIIRKDKALAVINEKIVVLKQEVEKVEETVRDELTQAYDNKVKKVEKQRKQLDARHQHIQEVEDLLQYYARTGQTEKLADLMAQLDIQYEN